MNYTLYIYPGDKELEVGLFLDVSINDNDRLDIDQSIIESAKWTDRDVEIKDVDTKTNLKALVDMSLNDEDILEELFQKFIN
jgi:hypothetical protein